MNKLFRIIAISGILAATAVAEAQNTNSGYFLDGYTYRYQLNPAFGGKRGFVSIPAIGNLNLGLQGSVGLESFVYKRDGRTVLFTNPLVSTAEVLKNFPDNARLQTNIKINVLSIGFKGFGGYNALSINARANAFIGIPNTFMKLAKEGLSNTTYNLNNLGLYANAFAEIGLTHSRDIKQVPGLRAGVTVKALVGMGNIDANFKKAHLTLDRDDWYVETEADMYACMPKLQFEHDYSKTTNREYVSGINMDGDGGYKPQGYGMAFDLGATYQWKDLNFSLALLDLGWISYSKTLHASTDGVQGVHSDAFTFNVDEDSSNSFDNELDRLEDQLGNLYQLNDKGEKSHNAALGATLNIGVEYRLPIVRFITVGLLNSTFIKGKYSWNETRLSANVAPLSFLSVTANGSVGTFGPEFGWLLSFHPKGINLFVGMDAMVGKLSKQYIPLSTHASLNFGLNITF